MPSSVGPRRAGRAARQRSASRGRNSPPSRRRRQVFLNLPFDDLDGYQNCFLASVAGLVALDLIPRSVLEIPSGGSDRLTRIYRLMRECRYSVHDLSRVQLRAGRYPRFNMPFEAGMATSLSMARPTHDRYVFATRYRVVQQVASDLGGVDVYEHRSRPRGVLTALRNAFVRRRRPVTLARQIEVYTRLLAWVAQEGRRTRTRSGIYRPALFRDIVAAATAIAAGR